MDTTDLKQAQQLFQLATEASPSGVVLADAEGRIVLVNAHVEGLFGYGRDELIGKSAEILVREGFAFYDEEFRTRQDSDGVILTNYRSGLGLYDLTISSNAGDEEAGWPGTLLQFGDASVQQIRASDSIGARTARL